MPASLRFLLLGIALILFGIVFQGPMEALIFRNLPLHLTSQNMGYLIASIFPLAGLIVTFVGFFKRDNP